MEPTGLSAEQPLPDDRNSALRLGAASPLAEHSSPLSATSPEAEREWIRRIANGDRTAFERLFNAYYKRLFGYLFRMTGKKETAEELANDVMLAIWKGAAGFKGESKLSTWIFGIAHFRAISSLRRNNPETVEIEEAGPLADSQELQENAMVREGAREEVRKALVKLTAQHREVVELTFYQEFSYPEIAAILNCPVNTVKTRMFYARKQLREFLEHGRTT